MLVGSYSSKSGYSNNSTIMQYETVRVQLVLFKADPYLLFTS